MKIPTEQLLNDLKNITAENMYFAENILNQPDELLNFRLSEKKWSVLECFEHLNRYGKFYIPEIGQRINNSGTKPTEIFNSGILGNYFAESMLPNKGLEKMKTFRSMNPLYSNLDKKVLDEFIAQQKQIIILLNNAEKIDLNKTKTGTSISNLIRLKLGDTFRFVVYHNLRHIEQAKIIFKSR